MSLESFSDVQETRKNPIETMKGRPLRRNFFLSKLKIFSRKAFVMKWIIVISLNLISIFTLYHLNYYFDDQMEALSFRINKLDSKTQPLTAKTEPVFQPNLALAKKTPLVKKSFSFPHHFLTQNHELKEHFRKALTQCEKNLDTRKERIALSGSKATIAFQRNTMEKLFCKLSIQKAALKEYNELVQNYLKNSYPQPSLVAHPQEKP